MQTHMKLIFVLESRFHMTRPMFDMRRPVCCPVFLFSSFSGRDTVEEFLVEPWWLTGCLCVEIESLVSSVSDGSIGAIDDDGQW